MTKSYWIRILLPGGDPDGLRIIEKSNWSGVGLVVPRSLLRDAKRRPEAERTGVYVLVGLTENSGLPTVYIGEGDPIRPRLDEHASKKDFWTTLIAFTSKDTNLNKAHVQYLEARLYALAVQGKRCILENVQVPGLPSMSEADVADAEGFLAEMLLCFPVLNAHMFTAVSAPPTMQRTYLLHSTAGIKAKGAEIAEGFLVREGSDAVPNEVPSCPPRVKELRRSLVENGVLKPAPHGFTFSQDYVFSSPSLASDVVFGRSSNGRIEWKTEDGRTLKEIQEAEASA